MDNVFNRIAFHKNGKPRGWVRRLLFKRDNTPRRLFKRFVIKKNGCVRSRFSVWTKTQIPPGDVEVLIASSFEAGAQVLEATPCEGDAPAPTASSSESDAPAPSASPSCETFRQPVESDIVLSAPPTLQAKVKYWIRSDLPEVISNAEQVTEKVEAASAAQGVLVLALSHDNYTKIPGGVQVCLQREEREIRGHHGDYLHVRPFQPLPRLAHLDELPDPYVELMLNGAALATCRMSDLISAAGRLAAKGKQIYLVIHHLLGFHPEQVSELAVAANYQKSLFWLHDFFSICPSYLLLRNDRAFCNAPGMQSNSCSLCIYGEERPAHAARISALFNSIDIQVVAPSEVTLAFWRKSQNLKFLSASVQPHLTLEWKERAQPRESDEASNVIRIGFLGQAMAHKGWPVFDRLVNELPADGSYSFVVLGVDRPPNAAVKWCKTKVTVENVAAMADAVAADRIDVVLHWANWPETFSFTTFEALEGGAFVLTNAVSGNVAAFVAETGFGAVLKDEDELIDLFLSGKINSLVAEARKRRCNMVVSRRLSGMSAPLLFEGH